MQCSQGRFECFTRLDDGAVVLSDDISTSSCVRGGGNRKTEIARLMVMAPINDVRASEHRSNRQRGVKLYDEHRYRPTKTEHLCYK